MPTPPWWERHQIACYLVGLCLGALTGAVLPTAAPLFDAVLYPVLGALLYATFLQVPARGLVRAFKDVRFLLALLVLNFAVVPLVVAALTGFVALPRAVLLGVLLVLLTPCVDYVIVFSGLAGAASERLVAASPVLLLAQMLALPVLLLLFLGPGVGELVDPAPFLEAFLLVIALPLVLAWLTEAAAARYRTGERFSSGVQTAMVPLLAVALFVVVAGQVPAVRHEIGQVVRVVPLYVAFLVVMALIGVVVARLFGLDAPRGRALVFSGATRNSLVVLPLALALPAQYALTPAVVVTQTLVELAGMLVCIRLVPRLLPTSR
ncbi:arsenic resistance protein [Bounagaea algeriensis]